MAGVIAGAPVPVAHLAAVGIAEPAAANHATFADEIAEPIPAPFLYVTAHVVQAVAIRLFLCNWMCFFFAVLFIPSNLIQIIATTVFEFPITPCGIVPFTFCRQALAIGISVPFNIPKRPSIYRIG